MPELSCKNKAVEYKTNWVIDIKKFFSNQAVPAEYRSNFLNLYFDIGWFGVLSGSSVNFLSVYATRIGATGFQIGLLAAVTAIVSLVFAIPAGRWLESHSRGRAVFWVSVCYRLGFLLYIPLPLLLNANGQIWALILISLLMGVPLIAFTVGFSNIFADSVPGEWRSYVAGVRNSVLSIMFMITSLVSGYLLDHLAFPLNYQIIFFIGFVGAAMSSYHLYFIKPILPVRQPANVIKPDVLITAGIASQKWRSAIRTDIWATPYRSTLLVLLAFHLAQYLALPIFPLYLVNQLKLTDENLGIGTALFYLTVLIGSTQLNRLVKRSGHKNVTGWGAVGMAIYPILMAISSHVWQYYALSIIGGIAWGLVGGALANYVIEKCPENDRPSHLAWYNMILNASILAGSLLGPIIATGISLQSALIVFGLLRALAGIIILRWG
jgi:MFS family permease